MTKELLKDFMGKIIPSFYITNFRKTKEGVDSRIVTFADKTSYVAEQFKIIRNNLFNLSFASENPIKTILITSAVPQEGKTITACNLAYAISLDKEKKVLLVDADLRKPLIHALFGLSRSVGLSDLINNSIELEHLIKRPIIDNLYIISSGNIVNNPPENLNHSKIEEIITKLKAKFDYIIFDSPPVLTVVDTLMLAPLCDMVILIVKAGSTDKKLVEEAFDCLKNSQAKPRTCVLTNANAPQHYYYKAYYTKEK